VLKRRLPLIAIVFAAWLVFATVNFVVHHDDRPAHADAIVVLQGSKTRLPLGYKLMEEGYAPLMLISRGSKQKLEDRLCNGETRFKVICFSATSTRGEARIVSRIARERHLSSIEVVTSQFHIFRARKIFERCFHGELRMIGSSQQWWKLPIYMVTETGKLFYQSVFARGC
jgi:uncharacterized SAM-binding protein YcdF (DUF218 family)